MAIISASYKTDIPAFYGEWFLRRLHAKSCMVRNAWNNTETEVRLDRKHVDGIVFWTKNLGPFIDALDRISKWMNDGYPFIVQYTINGYPRDLEVSVVNADRSIQHMHTLASKFGAGTGVWRYDPIVFTNLTDHSFHVSNFRRIAEGLKGSTDEVVLSFVHLYDKTLRNMNVQSDLRGFTWRDPEIREKNELLRELAAIAAANGMKATMCSQPENLVPGVEPSRCVDAARLRRIWKAKFKSQTRGNRPGCLCASAKDIGDYDTCPHGCVYCYAVKDRDLAKERFKDHDPLSEFLFMNKAPVDE